MPRVFLDAGWFVEATSCSTLGRGLEISSRAACLPIAPTSELTGPVTLYLSLPGQARMFRARGQALRRPGQRGWVIRFAEVSPENLRLLSRALSDAPALALPANLKVAGPACLQVG